MTKRFLLVLCACLLTVSSGVADEEPAPPIAPPAPPEDAPLPVRAEAVEILDGTEGAYAALRARLAKGSTAELLKIIDEVRAESRERARAVPDSTSLGFGELAPQDPRAGRESAILDSALGDDPWMARVEAYLVRVREDAAVELLGDVMKEENVAVVPARVARKLLAAVDPRGAIELDNELVLDLLDGQSGSLAIGARVRYLMDYEVEIPWKVSPLVGEVREGTVVAVRVQRAGSDGRAKVDLAVDWAQLRRPVALFHTRLGSKPGDPGVKKTIQLPELGVRQLKSTVDMKLGSWVLALGKFYSDALEAGVYRIVLLRVTRIAPAIEEPPPPGGGAGAACGK